LSDSVSGEENMQWTECIIPRFGLDFAGIFASGGRKLANRRWMKFSGINELIAVDFEARQMVFRLAKSEVAAIFGTLSLIPFQTTRSSRLYNLAAAGCAPFFETDIRTGV
jgi:hypothetical protein